MSDEPNIEKESTDRRIYDYWMSAFKRAGKKIPKKEWDAAETRYRADDKNDEQNKPVVNDLRNHIEVSRAYLDQRDPAFKVIVSPAFADDEEGAAQGQADCERKYLEYVWGEQECQAEESQKLDSALIRNIGFTMPVFDMKKWMPGLRYLPAGDVRLDPDCGGLMKRASWVAYREDISIETLMADVKITKDEIELIKKKNASVLDEEEQKDVGDGDKELYLSVTRWHVFARNDAAVRDFAKMESEQETEPESLVDELKLKTERRYLQFVEGIPRPVKDADKWPFDLDHNEFPPTIYDLNQVPEDMYGFTDYKQMERMDTMSDTVMRYIESDAFYSAITKYAGGSEKGMPSKETIDNWLNNSERAYLPDMLGEDGKPLMQEIKVATANQALVEFYNLFHEQSVRASADSELAIESVESYKDVTAMGVRADMERRHQRNNRRLGGPRGYEKSIQEDAVKMLEIAHQFVPRHSVIDMGVGDDKKPILKSLPWPEAQQAILAGGHLLKLGIDAIVGEELSEFWKTSEELPMVAIRLSTKVHITPGSTRNLTQAQQAAELTQFYNETLYPTIYEPMGRYDLAAEFIKHIAMFMQGLDKMDDFLPTGEDVKAYQQQQQEAAQAEQQAEQQKAETEMAMLQQKGDSEQRSAELQIGTDAAKAEIDIERDTEKGRFEAARAAMKLKFDKAKADMQARRDKRKKK